MIKEILWSLSILCWQDIGEIFIIFSGIMYLTYWFKKDTQKPLLFCLYSYIFLFLATDFFLMTTINSILFILAPIALSLLIALHKETLQKNFIALHAINTKKSEELNWPEILLQATLFASNKNIRITCIIEKNNSLIGFTKKSATPLEAPITKDLLEAITTSSFYNQDQFITINQNGKIISINDSWEKTSIDFWLTKELQQEEQWIQDGIFFTQKTDAFMYRHNPLLRTYSVITQGKLIKDVTTDILLQQIFEHINMPLTKATTHKGKFYGNTSQKSSFEQSVS